ncbi:PREDICTED: uncharacterized protein LOC108370080 isoform X1 [Rhagoletis zephyria]|uniref:uncharacterized protein LOC108370080 isoform X1 n=2 Tax=Rhagoletis zephyria TaxID=28612 RepID=UPI0008116E0C|nr:PREDICTED: uncharacterized protein LOC108370080 isoform X1 [Rhagoletis zephyria]
MNMTDSALLRALLGHWGVPDLWPLLQAESIGIDELKMMKNHHIVELLHSYKLGTRIRFEYYFERWRRDQNKPLLDDVTPNQYHSTCSASAPYTMRLPHSPPQGAHKKQQSRATNTVTVRYATVATNTSDMMLTVPTKDITPPTLVPLKDTSLREMPKLTRQHSILEESLTTPTTTNAAAIPNATTMATPSCPSRLPPKFQFGSNDSTETEQADTAPLLHILNSSGIKGNSLLEYYQQHKQLTNVHRTLLIQLIVNFFDLNEYHLSLKVSHSLEEQILKLFPTEKLECYRTEKRGKIYVKFCNMKRYKRDKPTLKRKWLEDVEPGDEGAGGGGGGNMLMEPEVGIECGDEDVDDYAQSFEYWHAQQSPSGVQVKTESLSDGDY